MRSARWQAVDGYGRSLAAAPVASSEATGWRSGPVRRWTGVSGEISQPSIDHHYVVLHLGGPKHVTRRGGGRSVSAAVDEGALTLVPAGTRYEWSTVGPIDFAHLYVHPSRLSGLIASGYGRDPSAVALHERVGFHDPLLAQVIRTMLAQVERWDADAFTYLDALLDLAVNQLAHEHSTLVAPDRGARLRASIAPARLRRVLEYADARIAERIGLEDLAKAAGLSRFHFSRAFRNAMGEAPCSYLTGRRVELAKRLLRTTELPLAQVGLRVGLGAPSAFAAVFRRRTGRSPSAYRRQL